MTITAAPILARSLVAFSSGAQAAGGAVAQQHTMTFLPAPFSREGVDKQATTPAAVVQEALLWLL